MGHKQIAQQFLAGHTGNPSQSTAEPMVVEYASQGDRLSCHYHGNLKEVKVIDSNTVLSIRSIVRFMLFLPKDHHNLQWDQTVRCSNGDGFKVTHLKLCRRLTPGVWSAASTHQRNAWFPAVISSLTPPNTTSPSSSHRQPPVLPLSSS